MNKFKAVPTKVMPDYMAVVDYAKEHGYMLLDMDTNYNALHVAAYRHGFGVRKVYDSETGVQIGWKVAPLCRTNKRK